MSTNNAAYTPGGATYGVRPDGTIWLSIGDWSKGAHHQFDFNGSEPDARLISQAFNVADETGLTPRQLAEQRAELLEALRNLLRVCDEELDAKRTPEMALAREAIAKAQGGAK